MLQIWNWTGPHLYYEVPPAVIMTSTSMRISSVSTVFMCGDFCPRLQPTAEDEEEEEEDDELPKISMLRLLSYNRPEYLKMIIGGFCALGFGVIFPSFGIIFGEMLNVSVGCCCMR